MKPTINEIEKAKEIVNKLVRNNFLEAVICEDNNNYFDWCQGYAKYFKDWHIKVFCGETKACIISEDLSDWVIKVGFRETEDSMDFCQIEASNYEDAIRWELDEFFASCYELCDITPSKDYNFDGDITFYIQEKAKPDEEKTSSTCSEYTGSDWNDDNDRLESLFRDSDKFEDLLEFIDDWNINDLHSGNFGYTSDGRVKIIDYSGYNGE